MNKYNTEENLDCALEGIVDDIKESIRGLKTELKDTLRVLFDDINYCFSELREGLQEIFEDPIDSTHGGSNSDYTR